MRVIVLGAGLLGVTSAYFLQQLGHEVTVIDRQGAPGAETSFANGGQISVSHAEPWANPSAPLKVLQWLGQEDAPLLFRIRADMRQWLWGLSFLRNCTPARTRHNIEQIVRLGTYSRSVLQQLRADTGIQYDQRTQGILHFYTNQKEFDGAWPRPSRCAVWAASARSSAPTRPCASSRRWPTSARSWRAPPSRPRTSRATPTSSRANWPNCARRRACSSAWATTSPRCAKWRQHRPCGIDQRRRPLRARARRCVCAGHGLVQPAAGPAAGHRLPIYPAKGYSVTMPVKDASRAHQVSLTDDEFKLVFSRYTSERGGDRLRIAGTAELNGYDRDLNQVRCEAIVRRVEQLFPGAGDASQAQFWTGLRPATPSNVPLIGQTKVGNLFLNTGHGTLGWTHACGSGKALADIVSGRVPEVDFAFQGMAAGRGAHALVPAAKVA
jgi:D-amino-acid dehydrogenase